MNLSAQIQRSTQALSDVHGPSDPFAAAVRATKMAMVVTDPRLPDHPIVFANDAFVALSGYGRDEILGRNCRFMQGPETDPAHVDEIRTAIREGRDTTTDILNYRKSGESFWNALYLSPVRDESGEVVYFFGSQLDVTEKRRVQTELLHAKQDLEAAVEERTRDLQAALDQKSALLHEVDHRVKNNLQLIASLIMLQMRRTPEGEARTALRAVLERVGAISTVHRRLFQTDDVERFDVGQFLRDLMEDRVGAHGRKLVTLPDVVTSISASQAASLALLVNELVSYAQDGGLADGVSLSLLRDGGEATLSAGAGPSFGGSDPFGREIAELLARQLRGSTRFVSAAEGRRAELTLPLDGL